MPDQHLDFDAKWDGREAPVKDNPAFNQIEVRRIDKNQAEVERRRKTGSWWLRFATRSLWTATS